MLEDFPFLPSFPLPGSDLVGGMVFHPIKLELPNLNDEAYIASRIRSQRSYIFKKRRNWSIAKQSSPVRCSGGSKSSKFRSYILHIYFIYIYIYHITYIINILNGSFEAMGFEANQRPRRQQGSRWSPEAVHTHQSGRKKAVLTRNYHVNIILYIYVNMIMWIFICESYYVDIIS